MAQPAHSVAPWLLLGAGIGVGVLALGYKVTRRPRLVRNPAPEPAYEDHWEPWTPPPYEPPANAPETSTAADPPEEVSESLPPEVVAPAANQDPGLAMTSQGLEMRSWDDWMRTSPRAIELALQEGGDVEQIATNVFRRLYPGLAWPPEDGTPLHEQWLELVATIARTIEQPFPTHLRVVT